MTAPAPKADQLASTGSTVGVLTIERAAALTALAAATNPSDRVVQSKRFARADQMLNNAKLAYTAAQQLA